MSHQFALPLPQRAAMGIDDFLVTDSNFVAFQWLTSGQAWPSPCAILTGPEGCGKTHALHVWCATTNAQFLKASDFLQRGTDWRSLFQDVEHTERPSFRLAIDDASDLAQKAESETTLFHLYNALRDINGQLLLADRIPVKDWGIQLPDLRSRLLASLALEIAPPDDALMAALLMKHFGDRQLTVAADVIDYLLSRLPRTAKAIRDAVSWLDTASLAERRNITIPLARQWIDHRLSMQDPSLL